MILICRIPGSRLMTVIHQPKEKNNQAVRKLKLQVQISVDGVIIFIPNIAFNVYTNLLQQYIRLKFRLYAKKLSLQK